MKAQPDRHDEQDHKDQEKTMTLSSEQLTTGTEAFVLDTVTIDFEALDRLAAISSEPAAFADTLQAAVKEEDEDEEDEDDDEDDDLDEEDDLDEDDDEDEDEDEEELEYEDDDDDEDEDEEEDEE